VLYSVILHYRKATPKKEYPMASASIRNHSLLSYCFGFGKGQGIEEVVFPAVPV